VLAGPRGKGADRGARLGGCRCGWAALEQAFDDLATGSCQRRPAIFVRLVEEARNVFLALLLPLGSLIALPLLHNLLLLRRPPKVLRMDRLDDFPPHPARLERLLLL